jgi:anti-sigma28 factor (negative regulator of flagellin synthesis)
MISKVQANAAAYLQQIDSQNKNESQAVSKTKKMDKVEYLKEQIQKGDYNIDTTKTAQAIARDLI